MDVDGVLINYICYVMWNCLLCERDNGRVHVPDIPGLTLDKKCGLIARK
jgi:hypothetical protein